MAARGRLAWLLAGMLFLPGVASAAGAGGVPPNCEGSGLGISLFTGLSDVRVGERVFYTLGVFNGTFGGLPVVCDANAIQAFIVTPDGLTNAVPLVRTTLFGRSDCMQPTVPEWN